MTNENHAENLFLGAMRCAASRRPRSLSLFS
jgi:hypothetical protein